MNDHDPMLDDQNIEWDWRMIMALVALAVINVLSLIGACTVCGWVWAWLAG